MDCYSDFFSLLSLSQVNSAASFTPPEAGIAPSLNNKFNSVPNGHRLSAAAIPTLSESMSTASYSQFGVGPVLVANHCPMNVDEVEMMDGSSSPEATMAASSLSTCRQVSGFKRKRGSHHQPSLGDAAEMLSSNWAAMPATSTEHDPMTDLQPDKQKRVCTEAHSGIPYPHHHQLNALYGLNHHLSPSVLPNNTIASHSPSTNHLNQSLNNSNSLHSGGNQPLRKNTFASQKLNICTAGTSILEEGSGSSMHIHVPGLSVSECPRCLAGEPGHMEHYSRYSYLTMDTN